jgi:hypothetical protein
MVLRHAVFVVSLAALAAAAFPSCSSSSSDAPDPALADVVYQGEATDEALGAMLAATVKDDPTRAANFSWQSNGDQLPLSPIPLFCWHIGTTTARVDPGVDHHERALDGSPKIGSTVEAPAFDAAFPRLAPPSDGGARSSLGAAARGLAELLLSGVPTARAHGTPMSGPGFLLVFRTDKHPKLLRVFTSGTEYTPNDAAWKILTTTGELVHVDIENAEFDQNRIAQDGGPYTGSEISFTFAAM